MLISPNNIPTGKMFKGRIFNFDTPKKNFGNLVLILTDNREDLYTVINSKLLRPQQMMSLYSPRIVRPLNRVPVRYDIQELYKEVKEKTNGKIKYCKISPNLYSGRNLIYDGVNEYIETEKMVKKIKSEGLPTLKVMSSFLDNSVQKYISTVGYEKNYIIFPFTENIENLRQKVISKSTEETSPIVLFLKKYRDGDLSAYKNVDRIFFFNPKANVIISLDPNNIEGNTEFQTLFLKIDRINKYNDPASGENLDDAEIAEENITDDDYAETMKDQLKEVVFKKMAKELKIHNLTDFESANKHEQEIILAIDKKIDTYLNNDENKNKSFQELVAEVETDKEVIANAIKYVESKRISTNKAINLSKNLDKEIAAIDRVTDITNTEDTINDTEFATKIDLDNRVKNTKLLSMDDTYNKNYFRNDINDAISSFSSSSYLPIAVDDISYEDTSDDFNEKETVKVRYKTDENQALSFQLDIPKIIDGHYMYIGGNKYTIAKQMLRLPIVKTKADRVEITTSYQKMTIERAGSKISRKNAYLLKILKSEELKDVSIIYGDNGIINNKYSNDFEFEELSTSISAINSKEYRVIFNRKTMEDELSVLSFPEDFIKDDMTPFALDSKDSLYYIQNEKIYKADGSGETITVTEEDKSLYDFITKKVLRVMPSKLPTIGKAFVYSKVKFLTVIFPIFTLVGLMNGITDILKRHNTEYQLSEKRMSLGVDWVEVKFKDKYFYFKDNIKNTMLLNVLYMMDCENYNFDDFDTDVPYMDYLVDRMGQPMYVKNTLMINLDKMIDPITRAVLVDLKLPTDIIDLLLLASDLLINNSYQPLNDLRNYRIRGNEIIAANLYSLLSTAYKNFQNYKMNGRAVNLVLGRNELISALIALPNINTASSLNPVLEVENAFSCSAKGLKGVNISLNDVNYIVCNICIFDVIKDLSIVILN